MAGEASESCRPTAYIFYNLKWAIDVYESGRHTLDISLIGECSNAVAASSGEGEGGRGAEMEWNWMEISLFRKGGSSAKKKKEKNGRYSAAPLAHTRIDRGHQK